MKRLLNSTNQPWSTLFNDTIANKSRLFRMGSIFTEKKAISTNNDFWKTALQAFHELHISTKAKTYEEKLMAPLWFNSQIAIEEFVIPDWYQSGIFTPSDIIKNNNEIMTLQELKNTYDVITKDFLTYGRIKRLVTKYLRNTPVDTQIQRPFIPHQLKSLIKDKKGIKTVYQMTK